MIRRAALLASAAIFAAACADVSGLDGLQFDVAPDGGSGLPCSHDADCKTKNPCKEGVCNVQGVCVQISVDHDPKDDMPGDCKKPTCDNGVEHEVSDPSDANDDGNPCTIDTCEADGTTSHKPSADGTTCIFHGNDGKCDKGMCSTPCSDNSPCKTDSVCTEAFCDPKTNKCAFTLLDGVPVPGQMPIVGDCKQVLCEMGEKKTLADPTDVPTAQGVCFEASCDGSTPKQTPRAVDTPCSNGNGGSFCDSEGKCVACTSAAQCPSGGTPCKIAQCTNHVCSLTNAADGAAVSGLQQTDGDCAKVVCNATGGTKSAYDATDPQSDGNACTNDVCVAVDTTQHNPVMNGTPCGAGITCMNGACGCTSNSDCTAFPNEQCISAMCVCNPSTCASLAKTCGVVSDGCGNMLNCNNGVKDGSEGGVDCGGASNCGSCAQGGGCAMDSDCATGHCADGVCCNAACGGCSACTAALKGGGSDGVCGPVAAPSDPHNTCNDAGATTCGNNGACDGVGACQNYPAGTVCGMQCMNATSQQFTCSGSGICVPAQMLQCPNHFACNGSMCYTMCTNDNQCANGRHCNGGGTLCQ